MNLRNLVTLFLMAPMIALAATVTVNGSKVGTLESLTVDGSGNVAVAVTGDNPPPPPPEPEPDDPFACVQTGGIVCLNRPFPVIQQELVSIRAGQILAIKVKVPESGSGVINTMVYAGTTAARRVSLSTMPGDLDPQSQCVSNGLEVTSNRWSVDGARGCALTKGGSVYINIIATNCPTGQTCKFWLKAN